MVLMFAGVRSHTKASVYRKKWALLIALLAAVPIRSGAGTEIPERVRIPLRTIGNFEMNQAALGEPKLLSLLVLTLPACPPGDHFARSLTYCAE
jgi:hypothetical protein